MELSAIKSSPVKPPIGLATNATRMPAAPSKSGLASRYATTSVSMVTKNRNNMLLRLTFDMGPEVYAIAAATPKAPVTNRVAKSMTDIASAMKAIFWPN